MTTTNASDLLVGTNQVVNVTTRPGTHPADWTLPRWPAKQTPPKQMQVKMKNGLARSAAAVDYRTVAIEEIALTGDLRRDQMKFAKDDLILADSIAQRCEVLPRANENVRGRLRTDVFKGENLVVFVNDLGRNLLAPDLAE
jgi:hypothetical protein